MEGRAPMRECPSSPGLRTLHFHCQGSEVWVQSLIEKKKKKKKGRSTGGEVGMTIEYSRLKGCGSAERPHCVGDCRRRTEGEEIGLGQHTGLGVGRSRASAGDRK